MIIIIETITDKTNQRTSPPCYRLIADVREFTLAAHSSQQPHVSDDSRITLAAVTLAASVWFYVFLQWKWKRTEAWITKSSMQNDGEAICYGDEYGSERSRYIGCWVEASTGLHIFCDFLLVTRRNYEPISYRFWNKWRLRLRMHNFPKPDVLSVCSEGFSSEFCNGCGTR